MITKEPALVKYAESNTFEIKNGTSDKPSMEPVKTYRLILAAVAANISSFAMGTCLGWTSPVAPKLKSTDTSDSPLNYAISTEEDASISSSVAIGALVAPFVAGPLADKIGRKNALLSSSLFFALAFMLMLIGDEVWVLLLGRLMQGVGVGFVTTVQPTYVAEIAPDNLRGAMGSFMQLFVVSGVLYVNAIGPFVSYQTLQWCCLSVPFVFVGFFYFMPESPHYYAAKARKGDALQSLQYLRGQDGETVQVEMSAIQKSVEESMANKGTFMDLCRHAGNRKALFIAVGLIVLQQLSGINVVLFNSQSIFQSANSDLDPAIASIVIAVVQVVSSAVTPFIADRMGSKRILLISAAGMSVGLSALGAFFFMKIVVGNASSVTWLPVPALVLFNVVFCIGFGPLPWAVAGEMFPSNVKSIASSVVASTCWILAFGVTRWYPALDALGTFYAFWLFALCCVFAFFFVLFFVLDTRGLTLQEIQNRLNNAKA